MYDSVGSFHGVLEFRHFRLDAAEQRPWCEERPVALRPKIFALLKYLAERPGKLVKIDELLDAVWKGERQIVFVTGDVGIGKTSVLREFVERQRRELDLSIGWGQSVEHHGEGEEYQPVLDALERLVRTESGPTVSRPPATARRTGTCSKPDFIEI